jgi:lipid II:glycine glycyltransferase (peptidoglycan interpeptide bridge formation enzyme)
MIIDENFKQKWNELWKSCKGGVYQSIWWIEIKSLLGHKPIFVTIEKNNKLTAGVCLFENDIKSFGFSKKILSAIGTPLFINREEGKELLDSLRKNYRNYFYITISPNVLFTDLEYFESAGYKRISNNTILIDLKKSIEELWDNLEKKSIRWGVKTAEKNGLSFEIAKEDEVEKFYKLYSDTATQGGFHAEKKSFIEKLRDSQISKLFVIKYTNKIVAGGLLLIDNNNKISTLDLTGAGEEGLKLQAMPYLYWKMINYSKELNLNYFDLGGYDNEAKEGDKTYNINKFKLRFGGEIKQQLIFSSNAKYSFIRNLMKRFHFIKKIYKKL